MWGRQEIEAYLKQRVCDNEGDDVLMFYGDLYDLVGIKNHENVDERNYVHHILGDISVDEHKKGRPLISVIVITQSDYKPGRGFFQLAREHLGFSDEYQGRDDDYIFVTEFKKLKAMKHQYC